METNPGSLPSTNHTRSIIPKKNFSLEVRDCLSTFWEGKYTKHEQKLNGILQTSQTNTSDSML